MIGFDGELADTSLEDVFELPAGYRCTGGFLVTYDLSIDTLFRKVLAPLAGLETGQLELLHRDAPELTVVCQRPWSGPLLPQQVRVVTFPAHEARPLHVKAGLVRFERDNGHKAHRRLVRAYVGSANLTDGGFGDKRETVAWTEDRSSTATNGTLHVAVAAICRAVAAAAGPYQADLDAALKLTLQGFFKPGVQPSTVRQTITDKTRLLDRVPRPVGFDRLDIVSPPYWQAHTGRHVAELLEGVLPDEKCTVRLLTSTPTRLDGERPTVAFPVSLVRALEDRRLTVQPGVIADDQGGHRRTLHAKLYALHGTTRSTVVLGSANATVSGLGGKNREAAVLLDLPRDQAEQLIDAVGPWHTDLDLDETALEQRSTDEDTPASFSGVAATFAPDDDQPSVRRAGYYRGTLIVRGLEPGAMVRVVFSGEPHDVVADLHGEVDVTAALGRTELDLRQTDLSIEVGGHRQPLLVTLTASAAWLDDQIARLDAPPHPRALRHPLEQLLLRDLRWVKQRRHQEARAPGAPSTAGDDRLSLPIDRRLQLLLRFRRSAPPDLSEEVIADYLDAADVSDPRVQVARAALQPDVEQDTNDPLITALRDALRLGGEEAKTP